MATVVMTGIEVSECRVEFELTDNLIEEAAQHGFVATDGKYDTDADAVVAYIKTDGMLTTASDRLFISDNIVDGDYTITSVEITD